MLKIHEAAALSGVTVRTLQYYHSIGLLSPSAVTEKGYRLYGEAALSRLQEILFLRELEFPLEQIREILDSPGYDRREALRLQKELLMKKRERLDRLIELVERSSRGLDRTRFEAFDRKEIEHMQKQYAQEAKERWGNTAAYRQSVLREAERTPEESTELLERFSGIWAEFAALHGHKPEEDAVQKLVEKLRAFMMAHYYDCTVEILSGLADLYETDQRFRENIDRAGTGTAAFAAKAIRFYCQQQ